MSRRLTRDPFLIFLPFLFIYGWFILVHKWPKLYGDEIRYVDFAHNLIHGFYSPAAPHINLWNGPGFPLVIWPFIALHVPALYITLLNAFYQYFAVVMLYKSVKLVANHTIALMAGLLLAIYPNAFSVLPILYTEALTVFLISAFVYSVTLCYVKRKNKHLIIAGLLLGFLTLVKIIFGYVLIMGLLISAVAALLKRSKTSALKSAGIFLLALGVTLPYLAYTYHLTNKPFYWGNSGGMSLYWMSTPYEHEYGDWKVPQLTNHQYPIVFKSAETVALLKKNHAKEIQFILKHNEVEQDALFKQYAIRNIRQHPFKFIKNYYYNASRMLFNFPYSYSYQDGAIVTNIISGSLILFSAILGLIATWINRRNLIFPVKLLLLISGIYLGLSGAVSAYPRQFDVMMPVLLFWLGFLASRMPLPSFRFVEENTNIDAISLQDLSGTGVDIEKTVKD